MHYHDRTDNEFFDLWFDGDQYVYEMGKEKVKCLNCPADSERRNEENHNYESFSSQGGNLDYEDENLKVNIKGDSINIKARTNNQ